MLYNRCRNSGQFILPQTIYHTVLVKQENLMHFFSSDPIYCYAGSQVSRILHLQTVYVISEAVFTDPADKYNRTGKIRSPVLFSTARQQVYTTGNNLVLSPLTILSQEMRRANFPFPVPIWGSSRICMPAVNRTVSGCNLGSLSFLKTECILKIAQKVMLPFTSY